MNTIQCPLCNSNAWPAATRVGAYAADCGTSWGDDIEPRQSPACRTIAGLRFEVGLLQMQAVAS